jgi:uncharacterized protein YjbJ (UPF0337 family)
MSTTIKIKGDWDLAKDNLKNKWGNLSDEDLFYAEGEPEALVRRIIRRTGASREKVELAVTESCKGRCS